jgi:hypothetical protein
MYVYKPCIQKNLFFINCHGYHVCDQHTMFTKKQFTEYMFIKMSKFVILYNYESIKCRRHHFELDSVAEHGVIIIIIIALNFQVWNQIIR